MRRGGWRAAAVVTLAFMASCGERPTGPAAATTHLRLSPRFEQGTAALPVLPVDEVRIRVFRTDDGELLAQKVVAVAPSDVELEVEIEVPATPGESLTVDLALREGGRDVYVGGPVAVVPTAEPIAIAVEYVGEGVCAQTVGAVNVGPIGGPPGAAHGRLELGDCYVEARTSFADRWTLDLPRDAGLSLAVAPDNSTSDLRLRLETPDGTPIVDAGLDEIHLFIGAGTYVAVVTSVLPLESVSYALEVVEFDRCDSETAMLAPGVSASQELTYIDCPLVSGRAADLWGIEVFVETPYRIDLISSAFDAELALTPDHVLDPFLTSPLAHDDDGGIGTNALLAGVLAPGRYRAWATSFSSGETGPYEISMQSLKRGAPRLEVRAVTPLGVGGAGGQCGSAQPFRFDFGYEDGDGDLVEGGGVTIRLTGVPSGLMETRQVDWSSFGEINPYAGFTDLITCETFATGETAKLVEFFITDYAGLNSTIFSTTLLPGGPHP